MPFENGWAFHQRLGWIYMHNDKHKGSGSGKLNLVGFEIRQMFGPLFGGVTRQIGSILFHLNRSFFSTTTQRVA